MNADEYFMSLPSPTVVVVRVTAPGYKLASQLMVPIDAYVKLVSPHTFSVERYGLIFTNRPEIYSLPWVTVTHEYLHERVAEYAFVTLSDKEGQTMTTTIGEQWRRFCPHFEAQWTDCCAGPARFIDAIINYFKLRYYVSVSKSQSVNAATVHVGEDSQRHVRQVRNLVIECSDGYLLERYAGEGYLTIGLAFDAKNDPFLISLETSSHEPLSWDMTKATTFCTSSLDNKSWIREFLSDYDFI